MIKYPTGVELHNGSLRINFVYKGKRFRKWLAMPDTAKNRKIAGEYRASIVYKIKMGTFVFDDEFPDDKRSSSYSKDINFIELVGLYMELKKTEIATSTLRRYDSISRSLMQFVNCKKSISTYTPADLLRIRNKLLTEHQLPNKYRPTRDDGRSVATVNNYMRMLLSLFRFAHRNKYIDDDITVDCGYLKKEKPIPDPLTEDEFKRLLIACQNNQSRNMLILSVYTGLRPGELTGLAWEDIDLVKKTIMVRRNVCGPSDFSYPKTGASTDRIVSLLEPAFNCLKDQSLYTKMTAQIDVKVKTREFNKYRTDSCTFVFQPSIVSVNGVITKFYSPGGFSQIWRSLIRRSGVRHRKSYQTRHTYACWMLSAGANPAFIATQMGHSSSKMVHDVYGAWMPENDQDQISLLNQKLNDSVPYVSPSSHNKDNIRFISNS